MLGHNRHNLAAKKIGAIVNSCMSERVKWCEDSNTLRTPCMHHERAHEIVAAKSDNEIVYALLSGNKKIGAGFMQRFLKEWRSSHRFNIYHLILNSTKLYELSSDFLLEVITPQKIILISLLLFSGSYFTVVRVISRVSEAIVEGSGERKTLIKETKFIWI